LNDLTFAFLRVYNIAEPLIRPITTTFSTITSQAWPFILPLLNRLAESAHEYPAIIVVGIFLMLILVVLQILVYVQNVMMFWYRLITRIVIFATLVVVVAVVWQRGIGRTFSDIQSIARELSVVWWREYEKWEGYQKNGYPQKKSGWWNR